MTMDLFENRKNAFKQISDEIVGSNTAIIGHRSQLYDLRNTFLRARRLFSFTIRHARILDITTSAIYSPKLESLRDQKLKFWFSEADETHTTISQKFDQVLSDARRRGFVHYDEEQGVVTQKFSTLREPLKKCGWEVRTWLGNPESYMTRKLDSTDGIILLDCVNQFKPTIEGIPYTNLGITKEKLISLLSRLETFGILKQTSSDQYIPYLSFELYGDYINRDLDDMLEDNFNRAIFEWIRKMPGISLEKIEEMAFEKFNSQDKNKLLNILVEMQKSGFLEIHKNNQDKNEYIVPVWLRKAILSIKPTRIESDMIGNAVLACGELWQRINDISEYYILIDNTIECLTSLSKEKELTFGEIVNIDRRIAPLLVSFFNRGLLKYDPDAANFLITGEGVDLTKVIIDILKVSSASDLWSEFVRGRPNVDSMENDFSNVSNEIHSTISDKYTAKDLKKFGEYK
jgi:hypothetical protein